MRPTTFLYLILLAQLCLSACSTTPTLQRQIASVSEYQQKCVPTIELNDYNINANGLTHDERLAVLYYSLGGFVDLNPALGNGKTLNDCQQRSVDLIDSALLKLPSIRTTTYRGAGAHDEKFEIGAIHEFKPYVSTTSNKEIADGFIREVHWTLRVKSAKDIKWYSNAPQEDELLLPRGSKFRIKKTQRKTIEIVPEGPGEIVKRKVLYVEAEEI